MPETELVKDLVSDIFTKDNDRRKWYKMIEWFMDLGLLWQIIIGLVLMTAFSSVVGVIFKTVSAAVSIAAVVAVIYFGWLFFTGEIGFGMIDTISLLQ